MYLVEVVVFLRFEEVEGVPLLFTGSSQQVIEDMVVPTKQSIVSRAMPVSVTVVGSVRRIRIQSPSGDLHI